MLIILDNYALFRYEINEVSGVRVSGNRILVHATGFRCSEIMIDAWIYASWNIFANNY